MKKPLIYALVICVPLILATLAYFFWLPEQIPVQLTLNGTRYANKAYIFIFAALPIIVYLSYDLKHRRK